MEPEVDVIRVIRGHNLQSLSHQGRYRVAMAANNKIFKNIKNIVHKDGPNMRIYGRRPDIQTIQLGSKTLHVSILTVSVTLKRGQVHYRLIQNFYTFLYSVKRCAGALITSKHVVSAFHCSKPVGACTKRDLSDGENDSWQRFFFRTTLRYTRSTQLDT